VTVHRFLRVADVETAAVHHRCITRTALDALLRLERRGRNRMAEPNHTDLSSVRRRIRLTACYGKSPGHWGLFLLRRGVPEIHELPDRIVAVLLDKLSTAVVLDA
jgi:hypothetical protein